MYQTSLTTRNILGGERSAAPRVRCLACLLCARGRRRGVFFWQERARQPFTTKQIDLATTFADQAVIAIENVRLFDEIQDKSRQLAEASQTIAVPSTTYWFGSVLLAFPHAGTSAGHDQFR